MAEVFTSGTDNDWGYGIQKFSDAVWICDSTLRSSSDYTSADVVGIIALVVISGLVIFISFIMQRLLWWIFRRYPNSKWSTKFRDALVNERLQSLLQLHRIAVQEATGQEFTGTLDDFPIITTKDSKDGGNAPNYGITGYALGVVREGKAVEVNAKEEGNPSDNGNPRQGFYATILRKSDCRVERFNPDCIR